MERKIVGADETVRLTPKGELERIAVYRFTLDALGPFTHEVPVKEDTAEKLREAMEQKEKILLEGVK